MRPHSQHLFNVIISKPDAAFSSNQKDDIEELGEAVRNDMEHLHQCFNVLNEQLANRRYLFSQDQVTYVDIIIFHEISQILCMAHTFRLSSRSDYFKKLNQTEPDFEENGALKKYVNLYNWYHRALKESEIGKTLDKFDKEFRDILEEKMQARVNETK